MTWRNAQASMQLISEINARWPRRDRASDGTIGDAAHAARTSDHNPWLKKGGQGIVRARDVDKDGVDAAWLVEHLRKLGAARDPRLWPSGYIIFNRRITSPDFSRWNTYNGSNPHTQHFHVSFSTDTSARGFDSTAGWGITGATTTPAVDTTQPAPPAVKKVKPVIIEKALVHGQNYLRIPAMVGSASGLYKRAWISISGEGGGDMSVAFQKNAAVDTAPPGAGPVWGPTVFRNASRVYKEIPSGTEYLECWITLKGRAGFVAVEFEPK